MLEEFVARFQCQLTQQYPVGDHIIFVGEVLQFDRSDMRPLVFHGGRYALAERRMLEKLAQELDGVQPHAKDRRKEAESRTARAARRLAPRSHRGARVGSRPPK